MKISCLAVIVASAAAEYNTADHAALHEHEYGTNVQSAWGDLSTWTSGTPAPDIASQSADADTNTHSNFKGIHADNSTVTGFSTDSVVAFDSNAPTPVPATQYPTLAPTAQPTVQVMTTCTYGGVDYNAGAHYKGFGSEYCNLCMCTNGVTSCTSRVCGATAYTNTCSHVTCSHTSGTTKVTVAQPSSMAIWQNYNNGASHSCQQNAHTGNCTCTCA